MKKSNRKRRGKQVSKKVKLSDELEKINFKVAGVDLANDVHYAGVSPHLTEDPIRNFNSFTADLRSMADWFSELGVESVAMEATGIYWQSLFELLEDRGFEVLLVNARYPKNVSGRKSDVADCSWIQRLHTYGLLPGSFIPTKEVREFRTYVRQRQQLTKQKVQHMQHVGKALQLMNVKVQNVISDIEGKLGMKVIRAIAAGQHSNTELAKFHNKTLKASKEDFTLSLEGNYRKEHLFSLKQALGAYDFVMEQINECETEIEQTLHKWDTGEIVEPKDWQSRTKKKTKRKNEYAFESGSYLKDITGVDLMEVSGFSENTIINILAEAGTDMSHWKNSKHFSSWAGLAPRRKISGDKLLGHYKNMNNSRIHQAFKLAAYGLNNSKCHLGALYRNLSIRKGSGIAVQAVARKLATIFYNMMKYKTPYRGKTAEEYQAQNKKRKLKSLEKQAQKMGMKLVKT